jgi:hypothetical protein
MKKFLFLECAIMVMIVTADWLFGAKTLFDFSQFFLWGGVVVMAFGMVSLMGQWGARTDSTYLIARTASDQNEINRAHQTFSDIRNSFSFLFETLILGGIPLIVGLLLN